MKFLYSCGHGLWTLLAKGLFQYRVVHPERIPRTGGALLAMNHQSFLDPPLAGIATDRDIYFLARKSLLKWPILGPIFPKVNVIPVDQERPEMSALKTLIRLVRNGEMALVFPEGERSVDGNLLPAQPGLGLVVAKTFAPVIPMRIFGSHEALPRGKFQLRCVPITVTIGHPIHFTKDDIQGSGREAYQRVSERVLQEIAKLTPEG